MKDAVVYRNIDNGLVPCLTKYFVLFIVIVSQSLLALLICVPLTVSWSKLKKIKAEILIHCLLISNC